MYRIILAVVILIAMSIGLSVVEGVTFTEEELHYLEDKYYEGPRHHDPRIDELMRYAYTHCVGSIGSGDIIKGRINYSCQKQSRTRTKENGAWGWRVVSPTFDHGICQLNYKRHKDFIDSKEFSDPINQIHYCQEVWQDSIKKGKMPRVAYWK